METFGYLFAIGMGVAVGWFLHKILREKGRVE
jgi:hypothetical protein